MTREEIERALRRVRPACVVVVVDTERGAERRPVALRRGQGRYRLAAAAICGASDAVSVELLDAHGALLEALPLAEPQAAEVVDATSDLELVQVARLLRDHTRDVVRDALTAQRELFEPTLRAHTALVEMLCERLSSTERDRARIQAAHYESLTAQAMAAAQSAAEDPVSPEAKAAMAQVLPMVLSRLTPTPK